MNKDFEKDILKELLQNNNITDISFNGKDIFIQDNIKGRYKLQENVSVESINNYIKQLTYKNNEQFNDENPILDTEFPNLRVNAVHNSVSPFNSTLGLRASKPSIMIQKYDTNIAPKKVFNLLETCIKAKCNVLISGKTGSGKTEMQKYLVNFINDLDKIVLIEDTMDSHLKELYPKKDILSWKTNNKISKPINFDDLIKTALRNNPDWIIISETRGSEAYSMLKSCLSGHHIITTLHSIDAKSNVERLIHMCKEKYNLDQQLLGSMICDNFDLGIHLDYVIDEDGVKRFISEIVEYVKYGNNGTIVNPLFKRITKIKKAMIGYEYDVTYEYGKISKRLFDKLADEKMIDDSIDTFVKEEYYEEENKKCDF